MAIKRPDSPRTSESPVPVPGMRTGFQRLARYNAFRSHERPQSRSFALQNQWLRPGPSSIRPCSFPTSHSGNVFPFNKSAEATCDELLLEKLHNMKKSIILSWAFSIIALTLVSCTSTSGTNTTTTGQTTGQTAGQTTAQTAGRAPAMPPPTQSSMGGPLDFYAIALRFGACCYSVGRGMTRRIMQSACDAQQPFT